MNTKIIIAGGTGFIGNYLVAYFRDRGYVVKIISRSDKHIQWEDSKGIKDALEDAEMLVNLAGKSVDCRYNAKNKQAILESRIKTTQILGDAIKSCKNPPKLWINSSTATIYRHAEDKPMTEEQGEIGIGFSVNVATNWEKAFFDFNLPSSRQVALRMAIVLGKDGGVMIPFKNLVRFGLGGAQGSGKQMFSWIHIEDLCRTIQFIQENPELKGVYNCAAPYPVNNYTFMKTLRKGMHKSFGLASPEWLLKIGAVIIRTETELILKSRWVIPENLLKEGFAFKYPKIEDAIQEMIP
ncbi:TIGR01777 family oxidoreductase [Pedobacter sp. MW01-1-1]|uniref:TIGR01777 family oxidoreductase n=1 Tax=Pedobacter sp. MW01-1-1 TaxID=3383027 RepID=UPI003FED5857